MISVRPSAMRRPPRLICSRPASDPVRSRRRLLVGRGCWNSAPFGSAAGLCQPRAGELRDPRAAVALYRGPLLEGFALNDSPAFEEWLLLRREQFNRQVLQALQASSAIYEQDCAYAEALACVRRIIELEPWLEEAHQQAMRLLALLGRRAEAIAQYRHCRALLLRELEVEPGPETRALYERIRDGAPLRSAPSLPAATPGGPPSPLAVPSKGGQGLPLLVAREEELARLEGSMAQALAGEGRIALVTGEAGSGKTALMTGFALHALDTAPGLLVAVGRCSAHLGAGEPYQPFRKSCGRWLAIQSLESSEHARAASCPALTLEALAEQGLTGPLAGARPRAGSARPSVRTPGRAWPAPSRRWWRKLSLRACPICSRRPCVSRRRGSCALLRRACRCSCCSTICNGPTPPRWICSLTAPHLQGAAS